MVVLVLNCGSSTLKFQVIETSPEQMSQDTDRRLAQGQVDRIGGQALLDFRSVSPSGGSKNYREALPVRDHRDAVERVTRWLEDLGGSEYDSGTPGIGSWVRPDAVGHRVVHGGERFKTSTVINEEVLTDIEDLIALAPLHNPANLKGIRAITARFGRSMPQVAVFDTAFHSDLAESAYLYGIPYSLYRRHKIRRYGFHGTSHRYVAYRFRRLKGLEKSDVNIVSLHLGNGCSACAIQNGRSIDTSMGMTPVEGLLMGTRCGDIDPSIIEQLIQTDGLTPSEVDTLLNKQSGLLGISGLTSDMRDLLAERSENQDRRATLAIDMFCRRVRKYIGAYLAELSKPSAIVFTGGIGQNAWQVRQEICEGLSHLGLEIDSQANRDCTSGKISMPESPLEIWVIPTDEELLIARDTVRCLKKS